MSCTKEQRNVGCVWVWLIKAFQQLWMKMCCNWQDFQATWKPIMLLYHSVNQEFYESQHLFKAVFVMTNWTELSVQFSSWIFSYKCWFTFECLLASMMRSVLAFFDEVNIVSMLICCVPKCTVPKSAICTILSFIKYTTKEVRRMFMYRSI